MEGSYKVVKGCDTADGKRYEVGDSYDPKDHTEATTKALLEMNCLDGDSQ